MTRIWEDAPYDKTSLLILLCLADMANDDGVCWPSVETIAKKARCSERWVRDVLSELERDGYIGKEIRSGRTTKYHLYYPPIGTLTPEVQITPEVSAPLSHTATTPELHRRNPGTGVQPNHKEPSIEPSVEAGGSVTTELAPSTSHYEHSINHVKTLFKRVSWHPSRDTWERAKILYPDADLGKVVIEYIQKNHGKGSPSETQWLSWCAQADKQVRALRMELQAKLELANKPKAKPWYHTAADD